MKIIYLIILFFTSIKCMYAQNVVTLIFDANHLSRINENAIVRLGAENYHNTLFKEVKSEVENINTNLSAVVLVQRIIYNSLTQIDNALKSSQAVINITKLVEDIYLESNSILQMAQKAPWLLLFAEHASQSFKDRSIKLALEVSDFVLKEGVNVLMDYEKRDFLLKKITIELKVIRAVMFSMHRSMYWAKLNGLLKTVNPYSNFLNVDKQKAEEILRYYALLKK